MQTFCRQISNQNIYKQKSQNAERSYEKVNKNVVYIYSTEHCVSLYLKRQPMDIPETT